MLERGWKVGNPLYDDVAAIKLCSAGSPRKGESLMRMHSDSWLWNGLLRDVERIL